MAGPLPNPRVRFFDTNGNPLAGGKVYTYVSNTSTPLATYTDHTESTSNTNPVILDANGEANIWIEGGLYKIVLHNSLDVEQWTVDGITIPEAGAAGKSFHVGEGVPGIGLGSNGDFYLDAETGQFYLKSAGVWGADVVFTPWDDAVNDTETAQAAAEAAQAAAEAAQAAAELAETNAETAETNAETAEANAETAETNAEAAQAAAEAARDAAIAARDAALIAEANAETAETNAETAETNSEAAQAAAELAVSSMTGFAEYANDAAFVSANGTAEDGDAYYNTTTNKVKVYTDNKWINLGAGGGGPSSLDWYLPNGVNDTPCIMEVNNAGVALLSFPHDETTVALALLTLPESYVSGTQILLTDGKAFSTTNSGNFILRTTSYIFKANIDGSVQPTGHTSTNIQQAIDSTTEQIVDVNDIDITDADGEINNVSVAPGDSILIKLNRLPASETSGLADILKVFKHSLVPVIS